MKIALVKYNAGNIQSVIYALNRLGIEPELTDNHETLQIPTLIQPVFGICVGQQLLCKYSEENDTDCLGVFNLDVKKFPTKNQKVPQIGWNNIHSVKTPLFEGLPLTSYVYFVHSYYSELSPDTIAVADYGVPFSAALHKNNF